MGNVPILAVPRNWECPNCGRQHVTRGHVPSAPFHNCADLKGVSAPLVEAHLLEAQRTRLVAVERMDDVRGEKGVRFDGDGVAIMSVRTERMDGSNDVAVLAPSAHNNHNKED